MLVIALVAVVGFAAFSPSSGGQPTTTLEPEATAPDVSARVASAILAIRVSEPENRTASTLTTTTAADAPAEISLQSNAVEESTTTEAPTTSLDTTTSSTPAASAPERDTTPPALRVTSPEDGSTVDDRIVTFSGTTEPGADVTSGPYEATVDDDGSWSIRLVLSPGPNGALFTATDDDGNTATVRIVVTYDTPAPTTTSAPATTTTQPASATTTTAGSTEPKWSPQWPADAGGKRNVEHWRPLVEKYWPAELVSCALNIIDLESQGDPRAWNSSAGAEGLFQHLSKYWKNRAASAGFKDANGLYATPYNAEANIAAAWYIAKNASPWHRPWSVNPFYGDCQS